MSGFIELTFANEGVPSLEQVRFFHPLLKVPRLSARGKLGPVYGERYSFLWTPAVQALTILMLRTRTDQNSESGTLWGYEGSPAASLDYAISKQPSWLLDMFGVDSDGRSLIRRLVRRQNPERKRAGPVALAINSNQLSAENIKCFVNRKVGSSHELNGILASIEKDWHGKKVRKSSLTSRADNAAVIPNSSC